MLSSASFGNSGKSSPLEGRTFEDEAWQPGLTKIPYFFFLTVLLPSSPNSRTGGAYRTSDGLILVVIRLTASGIALVCHKTSCFPKMAF